MRLSRCMVSSRGLLSFPPGLHQNETDGPDPGVIARENDDVTSLSTSRRSAMSGSIDETAIDKVLREAVDSGGVPHVAAIAADRDGVIYQGAAGPRAVGESDPVTSDTLFRIMSMTKMPC